MLHSRVFHANAIRLFASLHGTINLVHTISIPSLHKAGPAGVIKIPFRPLSVLFTIHGSSCLRAFTPCSTTTVPEKAEGPG